MLGFGTIKTSLHYPQANGLAERMVKTVKALMENSINSYMVLLSYRSTPMPWCGLSPAKLLMGWGEGSGQISQKQKPVLYLNGYISRTLDEQYKRLQKKPL